MKWARTVIIAVVATALGPACDEQKDRRIQPPNAPTPTVLISLLIDGPGSIAPGATAQFAVTARYSDGSTRGVTNEAAWGSSNGSVLSISQGGLATAHSRGEANISVAFERATGVKSEVMVLPPNTFRLMGSVKDAGFAVTDADVSVRNGEGTGLTARTGADGKYRLYGVAGDVEVRATKTGYQESTKRLFVSTHTSADFDIVPAGGRANVAGTYTLTITASPSCTGLPPEVRVRTYTAELTQYDATLSGTLEGADFFVESYGRLNHFSGVVQPDAVTFRLAPPFDYIFYLPDVVEKLITPTTTYLAVFGDAVTTGSTDRRSGPLSGVIEVMDSKFRIVNLCRAADHQFALSR